MPTVINEPVRTGEYIVSEANGYRSREAIVIASGAGALVPGTVLGKVTASGKYVAHAPGASDGSEAAAAILYGAVDATSADVAATAHVRDCEVNGLVLTWASGISAGNKTAGVTALRANGVIVRT